MRDQSHINLSRLRQILKNYDTAQIQFKKYKPGFNFVFRKAKMKLIKIGIARKYEGLQCYYLIIFEKIYSHIFKWFENMSKTIEQLGSTFKFKIMYSPKLSKESASVRGKINHLVCYTVF